ncbi:MAG: GNAT family N-acetyltransferase, partial [Pirellulaceae bacterium]
LPSSWDEFHARLSKNRRRAFRRLQRETVDRGRVAFNTATTAGEFHSAMKLFVDLHQKRRRSLGEPGCFASQRFASFIDGVSGPLWDAGLLELAWIELDGHPVGIEYCLLDANTTYVYQGGIDPDFQHESPGHLLTASLLQRAISCSRTGFDFLRGDEPYKASWNARPHATIKLRIAANRTAAHLRQGIWLAGATMKNWVKGGLTLTGMQ